MLPSTGLEWAFVCQKLENWGVMEDILLSFLFCSQRLKSWTSPAAALSTTLSRRTKASWASRSATSSSSPTRLTRTGTRVWSAVSPASSPSTTWRSSSHCLSESWHASSSTLGLRPQLYWSLKKKKNPPEDQAETVGRTTCLLIFNWRRSFSRRSVRRCWFIFVCLYLWDWNPSH